jgi:hypothetical protein
MRSRYLLLIILLSLLSPGNQKNKRSIRARVVWTGPQESSGSYKLGVECETPESGFWGDDYSLQPH